MFAPFPSPSYVYFRFNIAILSNRRRGKGGCRGAAGAERDGRNINKRNLRRRELEVSVMR